MNYKNYIPCFVREFIRKYKVEQNYGSHSRISTTSIENNVKLGNHIYLAERVVERGDR